MTDEKLDVDAAYALKTPDDNRRLYRDWAQSYDRSYAAAENFELPRHVAQAFLDAGGEGPVLDVGAGTGLVAEHLTPLVIDALDISPEMLAVARAKGLYRRLFEADLTRRLALDDARYQGVVSSGTFTHGHVGPDALGELLRVAAPGALFTLSIRAEHYEAKHFGPAFERLGDQITGFETHPCQVYGAGASPAHQDDTCLIARFRKTL